MREKKTVYRTAAYLRLSREDGEAGESDSIRNQKRILEAFLAEREDLKLVSIYTDDGYSGMSFERPGFQKMMEDVGRGEINCIAVKDLSRFSRNYIEAGRYMEKIFPQLGIRFIAVLDGYDSLLSKDAEKEILVPLKNILNSYYCADISQKTKSSLAAKREQGEYAVPAYPFGLKRGSGKNTLEADGDAAETVRAIYGLKIKGLSNDAIAKRLNRDGVPPPLEHKKRAGISLNESFKRKDRAVWHGQAVLKILKNPVYTGRLLPKGVKRDNSADLTRALKDAPQSFEGVISPDIYVVVQRLLQRDTRCAPGQDTVYLFSGFLYCGNCMDTMVRARKRIKEREYIYFVCGTGKKKGGCNGYLIREMDLQDAFFRILSALTGVNAIERSFAVLFLDYVLIGREKRMNIIFSVGDVFREAGAP